MKQILYNKMKAALSICTSAKFSELSDGKLKKGTFIAPYTRKFTQDVNFENSLPGTEQEAWTAFKDIIRKFSKHKDPFS